MPNLLRICEFLTIPFDPAMLTGRNYTAKPEGIHSNIQYPLIQKKHNYRQYLLHDEIRIIEHVLENEMTKLGYNPEFSEQAFVIPRVFKNFEDTFNEAMAREEITKLSPHWSPNYPVIIRQTLSGLVSSLAGKRAALKMQAIKSLLPMPIRFRVMELRGRGIYSGYFDKYKCIFIHIPKTAGTSVARALFDMGSRHVPYMEYENANPRKFKSYFKFAFVRNPWDRLLSSYVFLKQGGMADADRAWAENNLSRYESFEQFVLEWVTEENVWSWVHFMPQHHFICDSSGTIKMDFVGRMEKLNEDFSFVAYRIGSHAELPLLNRTREDHYSQYYSDAMRDIVAHVYAKDIEIFKYSFETADH